MSETVDTNPFQTSAEKYDSWYDEHPNIFAGELAALRQCFGEPIVSGLEVGVGTGRFAAALRMRYGIDTSPAMLAMAAERKITVCRSKGEQLPFASGTFNAVLLVTTLCFVRDREAVLLEAGRVLKEEGMLVVGFIDRDSPLGRRYQARKDDSRYYRQVTFISADEMEGLLLRTGFEPVCWRQTLFDASEASTEVKAGRGEGGFVALAARKIDRT